MNRGNRIYYDDESGMIIHQTMEQSGNTSPHPIIKKIGYIDIEFGSIDYNKYYISSIDVINKKPNINIYSWAESPEQKRIRELEDLLLMYTDDKIGGIL